MNDQGHYYYYSSIRIKGETLIHLSFAVTRSIVDFISSHKYADCFPIDNVYASYLDKK